MGRSNLMHAAVGVVLVCMLIAREVSVQWHGGDNTGNGSQPGPTLQRSLGAANQRNVTGMGNFGKASIAYTLYSAYQGVADEADDDGTSTVDNSTCAYAVMEQYRCSEEGCQDLAAGYINYIYFQQCTVSYSGLRILSGLLLVVWMLFLLHLVETTTNDYFVTSLQLAVAILKLSPNVAGVTFLAVGNAACDVIASVAAFATGVPKVGVGTTLGAGIFVTTAVVAAVSFVADVRLARRSFIRDVLFFIITIVYLLVCTLDGVITVTESVGFIIIYIVFVAVVAGGRCIRWLKTEDENHSFAGSSSVPVGGVVDSSGGGYQGGGDGDSTDASDTGSGNKDGSSSSSSSDRPTIVRQSSAEFTARKSNILSTLESARREAMAREHAREIVSLSKNAKYFAQPNDNEGDEGADGDDEEAAAGGAEQQAGGRDRVRSGTAGGDDGSPIASGAAAGAARGYNRSGRSISFGGAGGGGGAAAAGAANSSSNSSSNTRGRSGSIIQAAVDDIPNKPSKWTSAFMATQGGTGRGGSFDGLHGGDADGGGGAAGSPGYYAPFAMPKYHRKKLAKKLAKRLAARGIQHEIVTADGRTVDVAELALTDPEQAAHMIAAAAAAVTAEAVKHEGQPLTFQAAADAAAMGAITGSGTSSSSAVSGGGVVVIGTASAGPGAGIDQTTMVPVEDLLAVLPKETIKPISKNYVRFKRVFGLIGPYYHGFMHTCEYPFIVLRHLTIPLMHEGSYRRRLVLVNLPLSFALLTLVMTTHILAGVPTSVGGVPVAVLAAVGGLLLALLCHFVLLPVSKRSQAAAGGAGESTGLLAASSSGHNSGSKSSTSGGDGDRKGASDGASATAANVDEWGAANKPGQNAAAASSGDHGDHLPRWLAVPVNAVIGSTEHPMPTGIAFTCLLLLSFIMSLIWLLLIANELVGTALCFGKVLSVPDTVMGLAVLAVGNSINDLAASVTIAREGYPSMAVAGAYAGPMFNVLAGIGLPMLIYTLNDGDYNIGKDTPLVWAAFAVLLTSLTVTLIWVPLAGFRITHRIGRFLLAWFLGFIVLVIIMGSIPGLAGEEDVVLG